MGVFESINKIADAACAILGAREMCGNEAEALREWEAENGKLSCVDRELVWEAVEREWNSYRKAAGVSAPISKEERAVIDRIFAKS